MIGEILRFLLVLSIAFVVIAPLTWAAAGIFGRNPQSNR